jgi:hypothetical protein
MRRRHNRLSKLTKARRQQFSIASTAGLDALGKTLALCCNWGAIEKADSEKAPSLDHFSERK